MEASKPPREVGEVLDRLGQAAAESERVSIAAMLDAVGRRSFGPLLLVPGLVALSPLSGVPGIPTTVAVMVLLITGQFLLGRSRFWLPRWVLRRSAPRSKFHKALRFLRPAADWIDRLARPRLTMLTRDLALRAIAAVCLLIALAMPPLEFIPFAATALGAALTMFGLALTTQDGLLALVALGFCAVAAVLVVRSLI